MNKKENERAKRTFLVSIALFDFDKYYTPGVRFLCHLSMWLIFTLLLEINLFLDSGLPIDITIAFAARSLICNMTVFYLFFYVAVPQTLLKDRIAVAIVVFPFCIILWIVLNHYCLIFIGNHFKVEAPYYKQGVESNLHLSLWYLVSPGSLLALLTTVFYSISPYFFTKIVFDIVRFNSRLVGSETKSARLEIEKVNLEKDFLTAQLNPHFLFNTLNNLYGLALRADVQTAEMISQLSEMMRYTLYECNADKVPVDKELAYLKNYVMVEKRRYKADTEIVFNIDDSQLDGQTIAPLLTFTFVENGFKYGLRSKSKRFLKINISIEKNIFYFSIVNDKEEKKMANEFGGIGHLNTRKRLELIYPDKYDLKIEDLGKSFHVSMKINLQ